MARSNWKKTFESFIISTDPSVWKIEKEDLVKKNKNGINEANERFIQIDDTQAISAIETYGVFFGLGSVVMLLIMSLIFTDKPPLEDYLVSIPFFLLALFHLLVYLITGRKYVIMDRENCKLSYPQFFFKKEPISLDFNKVKVLISYSSRGPSIGSKLSIENRVQGSMLNGYWLLQTSSEREYWSFMVWYMDKNRPLPPGTAFDEYRDDDFERRKAASFPKPLFQSDIPTPESTPEQQAERKKIGGW